MSTFLPTELWNDIFRRVEREDLTTLARVSRRFQKEAEYILYHRVEFSTGARLASWWMPIVIERRRASCLHTLRLPQFLLPSRDDADSSTEIQRLLAQVFKAIVNLKELYIVEPIVSGLRSPTIVPSTFENCTFRLTAIAGSFPGLTTDEMLEFLRTQPDISYWEPGEHFIESISAIPPNTLPSIREVVLPLHKKLPLLYGRPIQKLGLKFRDPAHTKHDGLEVIHSLTRFNDTLRVLSYTVFGSLTDWTISDIIRSLAKVAPSIELLVLCLPSTDIVGIDKQKDLVEAISSFKHLHSLSLDLCMAVLRDPNFEPPDPSNPLEHDPSWTPDSPAQSRKVASMFMASCPSLRRISFPLKNRYWESVGISQLHYLCYGRSGGRAEAWLEEFRAIDWLWWRRYRYRYR